MVNGRPIAVVAERAPARLSWQELRVEPVIESTGRFTDAKQAARHLEAGAKRVVIAAPARGEDIR